MQARCYACSEYNYKWFVNDLENPYTTPPGKPYNWFRLRILGGRSLAWYRICYRYSDLDFKCASHDGYGEDWPPTCGAVRLRDVAKRKFGRTVTIGRQANITVPHNGRHRVTTAAHASVAASPSRTSAVLR
ncbi:MAG TPA: hypothetical protein VG204_11865 [Terriglobia bacterium]|nr:hypothetical protein [Terriglobia bacterium]